MGETFTRVAVQSNVGQIVLYVWSPLLFLLSLQQTLTTRRTPVALAFYTVVVAVLMMAPIPREVWLNSSFLYIAALSLLIYVYQGAKGDGWKAKLTESGSRLGPLAPLLIGLFFITNHRGVSRIEVQGSELVCSASPESLHIMAGQTETARQSDGLEVTSYWEPAAGSLDIRYSDTFRDGRGHYVKGAQVADFVEKWVANQGGANNVKFRRFKPTAYTGPGPTVK